MSAGSKYAAGCDCGHVGRGSGRGTEGGCTGALLLNNAQRACDDLVVDQHKRNAIDRDVA